jgi:competence protein ComEA
MSPSRAPRDRRLMQPPEARALRRAVTLLVLVSAARWTWQARGAPPASADESVLPELLATSREAAAEGARRAEPLGEGERLDPNRAPEAELDRLPGVGPATARAIVQAREEGAVFRRPEDLLVVRGIGPATLERIRAGLDLGGTPVAARRSAPVAARGPSSRSGASEAPSVRAPAQPSRVDLNRASAEDLESLPGIGPAIAARIVAAREEQMFTSLDDLVRVRGIGAATIERLRPHASVGRVP